MIGSRNPAYRHGMSGSRLNSIYRTMKNRCTNPNYHQSHLYLERGISICDEWLKTPSTFYIWAKLNGYKDTLTLDRIDNDKGYEPDNCRWITIGENCRNKRNNKLDWDKVDYIRSSEKSNVNLAKELGVSKVMIGHVKNYKQWVRDE